MTAKRPSLSFPDILLLLITLVCGLFWTAYLLSYSHFINDDFDHFMAIKQMGFFEFLLKPIDIHLVPMHRLSTLLIFKAAPYNFNLAAAVLLFFYFASMALLYQVLFQLSASPLNYALFILAAVNVFLVEPLMWWSSGIHRLPYIFLTLLAIHFYLRLRDQGKLIFLPAIAGSQLLALGFYSKALLIPGYLLALELCLLIAGRRPSHSKLLLISLSASLLISLLSVALYLSMSAASDQAFSIDWQLSWQVVMEMFKVLYLAVFSMRFYQQAPVFELFTVLLWVGLLAYLLIRSRRNFIFLLVLLAVIAANFFMLAVSQRVGVFGIFTAYVYRYYYELLFLIAIFIAVMTNEPASPFSRRIFKKPIWVQDIVEQNSALKNSLLLLFALAFTTFSLRGGVQHYEQFYKQRHLQAKIYLDNLQQDLAQFEDEIIPFADGALPQELHGGLFNERLLFQNLLATITDKAYFGVIDERIQVINEHGQIESYRVEAGTAIELYALAWDQKEASKRCFPVTESAVFMRSDQAAPTKGRTLFQIDYQWEDETAETSRSSMRAAKLYHNVKNQSVDVEAIYYLAFDSRVRQKAVLLDQPLIVPAFRLFITAYDPGLCITGARLFIVEPA